jgi:hypothetical protein
VFLPFNRHLALRNQQQAIVAASPVPVASIMMIVRRRSSVNTFETDRNDVKRHMEGVEWMKVRLECLKALSEWMKVLSDWLKHVSDIPHELSDIPVELARNRSLTECFNGRNAGHTLSFYALKSTKYLHD